MFSLSAQSLLTNLQNNAFNTNRVMGVEKLELGVFTPLVFSNFNNGRDSLTLIGPVEQTINWADRTEAGKFYCLYKRIVLKL